jgi:isoquinoline 1-oxidoreductase beta subunit
MLAVLDLAAQKAGWGSRLPSGRGRGIAVGTDHGGFVCHVAEVTAAPGGEIRVDRVVTAIDCGTVVNPDGVVAQIESAVAFALSATLEGEITFERGRVRESSYADFGVVRMRDMPVVEVHIVPSAEPPGGVGEPGVPPLAPAVANAVFAATGTRVRRLPIRRR